MPLSDEDAAALIAELEKAKWKKGLQKRKYEAELERLQYEVELEWLQYDPWLQSETVEIPVFPLLEGLEQSALTTVALAAEAPAAEVMTDTHVFPDTAASDASVERAAVKLTSAAGPSNRICGERRASTGILFPLEVHYHNHSSGNDNNTSNYGPWWDTACVGALLPPFDPGKGCQRDARKGKAVFGMDLPFDRGNSWGRVQHGG